MKTLISKLNKLRLYTDAHNLLVLKAFVDTKKDFDTNDLIPKIPEPYNDDYEKKYYVASVYFDPRGDQSYFSKPTGNPGKIYSCFTGALSKHDAKKELWNQVKEYISGATDDEPRNYPNFLKKTDTEIFLQFPSLQDEGEILSCDRYVCFRVIYLPEETTDAIQKAFADVKIPEEVDRYCKKIKQLYDEQT